MEKKYKIFALIGEAGCGKDFILQKLLAAPVLSGQIHEIISCTTRPRRQGEIDGKNYHFLTIQDFGTKVLNFELLEATEFNGWFYGTPISSLNKNKINIGIFNPDGIKALLESNQVDLKVYYLAVSDKIRLMRQLTREEEPDINEIFRRWQADNKDFDELDFPHNTITNNSDNNGKFVLEHLIKELEYWLQEDKNH